jgi:hypothetical protein
MSPQTCKKGLPGLEEAGTGLEVACGYGPGEWLAFETKTATNTQQATMTGCMDLRVMFKLPGRGQRGAQGGAHRYRAVHGLHVRFLHENLDDLKIVQG